MRKFLLPLLVTAALPLGGCAYVGLAPLVAEAVGEASRGGLYAGEGFADAAAEGCRGRAARHGRVAITRVEPHSANIMRVYGTIEDPYGGPARSFTCLFRSDGNIPSFRRS
jgi:hypothetical protein